MPYFLWSSAVRRWQFALLLLMAILIFVQEAGSAAQEPGEPLEAAWRDVVPGTLQARGERPIIPQAYRLLHLDVGTLERLLAAAPPERSPAAQSAPLILSLPLPDGSFGRFQIIEAPVMAPALTAKFPQIGDHFKPGAKFQQQITLAWNV